MIQSRLKRTQEKKMTRRIMILFGLSAGILTIILIFGLNILIGFSMFVDSVRGKSTQETQKNEFISPPILSPLPEATNSARLVVDGLGQSGLTVTLLTDGSETETVTADKDGAFKFRNLVLKDGSYTFTAIQKDARGNTSATSEPVRITIKSSEPKLEIASPQNDTTVRGEDVRNLEIAGLTDEGNAITVNGRVTVVKTDGSFAAIYQLSEGENIINILATDPAGNTTTVTRTIKYEK